MKIDKVTLTGLDSIVELDVIQRLSIEYPFVEWGILFSPKKVGEKRYPSQFFIDYFTRLGVDLSAHLCGDYARQVLEKQNFDVIENLHPNFKRVQLNYNFSYNQNWSITHLSFYASQHPERSFILQYNKSNKAAIDVYRNSFPENIHLLYDASGGRGTEIKTIQQPFKNYTGYAGGITESNVGEICFNIEADSNDANVWIDMESGIRTMDIFDLEKCETVLSIVNKLIAKITV